MSTITEEVVDSASIAAASTKRRSLWRLAIRHPSVIIGNKSSVVIGPGVFAGNGKGGYVPMENPSAPSKARCPVLDGVSYCF
mgnify:CR=1 FL=1